MWSEGRCIFLYEPRKDSLGVLPLTLRSHGKGQERSMMTHLPVDAHFGHVSKRFVLHQAVKGGALKGPSMAPSPTSLDM